MAVDSTKAVLRAKWRLGWEFMRAGKTTEGFDLLSDIKLGELEGLDAEQPDDTFRRVRVILYRQTDTTGRAIGRNSFVMEALAKAAKKGDRDAWSLLVFGDLEELAPVG